VARVEEKWADFPVPIALDCSMTYAKTEDLSSRAKRKVSRISTHRDAYY
jgi:hypothetical protein